LLLHPLSQVNAPTSRAAPTVQPPPTAPARLDRSSTPNTAPARSCPRAPVPSLLRQALSAYRRPARLHATRARASAWPLAQPRPRQHVPSRLPPSHRPTTAWPASTPAPARVRIGQHAPDHRPRHLAPSRPSPALRSTPAHAGPPAAPSSPHRPL
jgi:hypothetical protein